MHTLRRLGRYLKPQWRHILRGIFFMGGYAIFSGFSIGLVIPIINKIFRRSDQVPEEPLGVWTGLQSTFSRAQDAWNSASGGLKARFGETRDVFVDGLVQIQDRAEPLDVLAWLCVVSLVAVLLKNASDFGRKVAFIKVEQGAAESMRNDVFHHMVQLPLSTHSKYPSGQLVSRVITDVELVKQFTINTAAAFVHNLIQVLLFLGITLWASLHLSMVSFLIVPPLVLITGKLASKLRRQSGRAQERIGQVTSSLNEILANVRVVKAFTTEDQETKRFSEITGGYRSAAVRLLRLDSMAAPLSEFWGVLIGVGVLYYGGQLVFRAENPLSPERFFLFFLALVSMLHPMKVLGNVITRFQRGAAAVDRVFEILDLPKETDLPNAKRVDRFEHSIRFENVSFSYDEGRPVLREVSLEAMRGTTTALVGPSGGGKSTLVDMVPRFQLPTSGAITLDGVNTQELKLKDLRQLIGIVTQETILFDDTVSNNIAYGYPQASREQIVAAARTANAHEFIEDLKDGYETVIGERGQTLSGGQRQRLAIARAVLKDPEILILDEATSSLDTESEVAVQEALDRLLKNRTTFVIAHRLSTVMGADQILVLDEGRIVERGNHRELLSRPSLYRKLYDLQFRDEEATQVVPDLP
ncbi:MAG: ABC transporter ATP-binding protein [Candidatus Eisenbacteria bacterium]|uniref:ABC transporter ATP-binding protein n=1 Tax=Eiseniibacteriota bacterium TaxID=2212470 RepID=A0A7Y2H3K2_UNCEI|nr:ABC transporter ATP-binding protein [Candidatus Eisenbacteria bacterium]